MLVSCRQKTYNFGSKNLFYLKRSNRGPQTISISFWIVSSMMMVAGEIKSRDRSGGGNHRAVSVARVRRRRFSISRIPFL
jgi:hypothetical protein